MINIKTVAMIAVGLAVSAATSQAAIQIGTFGPAIEFNSPNAPLSSFDFVGGSSQWAIGTSTGTLFGPNGSYGFTGSFGSTVFTFDNAGNITGSSTLTIKDIPYWSPIATPFNTLTGTISFGGKLALDGSGNASINKTQQISVTGITYGGPNPLNPDLLALAAGGKAILNVSIVSAGLPLSMADLSTKNLVFSTTASITAVPEPSTYLAGLGALALFGFTAMPRRKQVK